MVQSIFQYHKLLKHGSHVRQTDRQRDRRYVAWPTRSNAFWRCTFLNQLNWFYGTSFSCCFYSFMSLCTS